MPKVDDNAELVYKHRKQHFVSHYAICQPELVGFFKHLKEGHQKALSMMGQSTLFADEVHALV